MTEVVGNAWKIVSYLSQQEDREKEWVLCELEDIRSNRANRYFHKLCDLLRQKLNLSMSKMKNILIASYGQIQYIAEGEPLIYKTNAPEDFMMEQETIHTKCVKVIWENGKDVFFYRVYRGSRTYSTAEMATLIRGTIQECEIQDIDTRTPAEKMHIEELWRQWHEK